MFSGDAKSVRRQSQERIQASGAELPGKHVASVGNLAVVCTIVAGFGDFLHSVLGDGGRLPLIRVGGAAAEIDERGGPVGQFGGVQDGKHRGEVVLVDVADAILILAEDALEFGEVLAIGDDGGGQLPRHLEPLAALAPLRGADLRVQLLPVPDPVVAP